MDATIAWAIVGILIAWFLILVAFLVFAYLAHKKRSANEPDFLEEYYKEEFGDKS